MAEEWASEEQCDQLPPNLLEPGGVFANLEHVASPADALHAAFLEALGQRVEDAVHRVDARDVAVRQFDLLVGKRS